MNLRSLAVAEISTRVSQTMEPNLRGLPLGIVSFKTLGRRCWGGKSRDNQIFPCFIKAVTQGAVGAWAIASVPRRGTCRRKYLLEMEYTSRNPKPDERVLLHPEVQLPVTRKRFCIEGRLSRLSRVSEYFASAKD